MQENEEPEVTIESLDAGLKSLIKAVDATEMIKAHGGVAIDQGGHVDDRGPTGGGYPGSGDMGGLDSMMVGKMQATLVNAGYDAGAIAAFMKKDEEEEEEDMEGKMGKPASSAGGVGNNPRLKPPAHGNTSAKMKDDDDKDDKDNPFGKSLDTFQDDPSIAEAIDVSPFLEALVQRTAEQLDVLGKSQLAQGAKQDDVNKNMAVAMYGIGHLIKGMAPVLHALDQRLSLVERAPNAPKGVHSVPQAQAMAKSFGGAAGGQGQGPQLTKSQVLGTLSYMNLEKGLKEIGGRPTSELIGMYEGGGQLAPHALSAAVRFLQTHPSEAAAAVSYR